MSNYQPKSEKFHPDNALPTALRKRFEADGRMTRSEIDAFRDRLFATCPSDEELAKVATAENPWEVLGQLEARPIPASVMKKVKQAHRELKEALTSPVDSTPLVEQKPAPELSREVLPARPVVDDPILVSMRALSAQRLELFIANFRKTRGVPPEVKDPATVLKGRDKEVYLAMVTALEEARKGKRA